MLEIKPFSAWSQDHSDAPPTEQYRGYSTYLRSAHFKNGTLNEQTENEINEGMYQKAVADGLIAEDAPDEEKQATFNKLSGAEPADPTFTNAQFLPDYLRYNFDRNSTEFAQASLVDKYLAAQRINSPLTAEHRAAIEPLLANQEMITAARKSAVDRGEIPAVAYFNAKGEKALHFGPNATRENISGQVDSLLSLGALDPSDLKLANQYLEPLNGGITNSAQAVRADAAFRFLNESINSNETMKKNFGSVVQKNRRDQEVEAMSTGERVLDITKQAIAIPFDIASELITGTGRAVGGLFGADYAPEEAPASRDLSAAKAALQSKGYSAEEVERYVADYIKHSTGPVYRADKPASGFDTDSLGNVLIAPELVGNTVKFDQALAAADLNEDQKAQAPALRKGMLEKLTPEYLDLVVGESPEALDAYNAAKAKGISSTDFLESWLSDEKNYDGFSERLQQFGLSTLSAVAQPVLGVFALGGSESASKGLAALNREAAQRQKYSRLFGDEYGLGFQIVNTVPQVGADILLSVGTGAAYTGLKATTSAGIKGVLRNASKQAVSELGEDAALAVTRASTLTGSTSEAFSKVSQGLTKSLNLAENYAPIAASSFIRSASSTYGQLYDELPEDMSHEEKHKAVLGTSILSGLSTMVTVVGMGLLGRGGVEDIATGGLSIGGKTVPMNKLTYRQMKMFADETSPVIGKLTDKAFQQSLRASMGSAYRNFFRHTLKGGFDEAVEEMLDQSIQIKIMDAYKNQDTPFSDFASQLWTAGVIGGALGGGTGAGGQLLSRPTVNDAIRATSARYDLLNRATERLKAAGSPVTASILEERMIEAEQRLAEERNTQATKDVQAAQTDVPESSTLNPDFGKATEDPELPRPAYTELLTDLEGQTVKHGRYSGRVVLEEDQAYLELDKPEMGPDQKQFSRIRLGSAIEPASNTVSRTSSFRVLDTPVKGFSAGTPFYQYGKGSNARYALPDPTTVDLERDFNIIRNENGRAVSVIINTARNFDNPDVAVPRTVDSPSDMRVLSRIYGFDVNPEAAAPSYLASADFKPVRPISKPAQLEFSYDPTAAKQGKIAAASWSIDQNKNEQPIITIPRGKQKKAKMVLLPPAGEARPGAVQVVYKEDNTVDYLFFPNTLTAGQTDPTPYFESDPERIQQLASLYRLPLTEGDSQAEPLVDDGHARFSFLDEMAGAQLPALPVVNPEAGAAAEESAAPIPVGEGQLDLGLEGEVPDYAGRVSKAGMTKAVLAATNRVAALKSKMPASAKADTDALTAAQKEVARARTSLDTAQAQVEKATDKTRSTREATVATRSKQLADAEQKLAAAQQAPSFVLTRAIAEAEGRLKDLQDASARTEAGEVIHLLGESLTPEQKLGYSAAVASAYPVEESSEAIINTILSLDPSSRIRTARRIAQQTYADFTPEQIEGALARAEAMVEYGVSRIEDGTVPVNVAREIVEAGEKIKSRIAAFQGAAVDGESLRVAKLVEDAGQALLNQYNDDQDTANPEPELQLEEPTQAEPEVAITVDSFPEVLSRFNALIQNYKEAVLMAQGEAITKGKSQKAATRAAGQLRSSIQPQLREEAFRIIDLIRQNNELDDVVQAEYEAEVLRTVGLNFDDAVSRLLNSKRKVKRTMNDAPKFKGIVKKTGVGFRTKQEKELFDLLASNGQIVTDLRGVGELLPEYRAVVNNVVYNAFTMASPDLQKDGARYYKPSEYTDTKKRMLAERVQELYPETGYLRKSAGKRGGYEYVVGKQVYPAVYVTGVKGYMRVLKKDGDPNKASDFTYVDGAYAPYIPTSRRTDTADGGVGVFTNNPVAVRAQLAKNMTIEPFPKSFKKRNPSIALSGDQPVGFYLPTDLGLTDPLYGDSKLVDPKFADRGKPKGEYATDLGARMTKLRQAEDALFLLDGGMIRPSPRTPLGERYYREELSLVRSVGRLLDSNANRSRSEVNYRLPITPEGIGRVLDELTREFTTTFQEARLARLTAQYVAKQLVQKVRKGQELSPDMVAYMEAKEISAEIAPPAQLKEIVELYAKDADGSLGSAASVVNITTFMKGMFPAMTIDELADHVSTLYKDTASPDATGVLTKYAQKLLLSVIPTGDYYTLPSAQSVRARSLNRHTNNAAAAERRARQMFEKEIPVSDLEILGVLDRNDVTIYSSQYRGDDDLQGDQDRFSENSMARAFEQLEGGAGETVNTILGFRGKGIEPIRLPAEENDSLIYTRSELLTDEFRKAVRENPAVASLVKQLAMKYDPELAVLNGVELLSKLSGKVAEQEAEMNPAAFQFIRALQDENTRVGAIGQKLAAHLVLSGWLPPSSMYRLSTSVTRRPDGTLVVSSNVPVKTRIGMLSPSEHAIHVGATSNMTPEQILEKGAAARQAAANEFKDTFGKSEAEATEEHNAFIEAARLAQSTLLTLNQERLLRINEASLAQFRVGQLQERLTLLIGGEADMNAEEAIAAGVANQQALLKSLRSESRELYGKARSVDKEVEQALSSATDLPALVKQRQEFSDLLAGKRKTRAKFPSTEIASRIVGLDRLILKVEAMSHPSKVAALRAESRQYRDEARALADRAKQLKDLPIRSLLLNTAQELREFVNKANMSTEAANMLSQQAKDVLALAQSKPYQMLADIASTDPAYLREKGKLTTPLTDAERNIIAQAFIDKQSGKQSQDRLASATKSLAKFLKDSGFNVRSRQTTQQTPEGLFTQAEAPVIPPPPAGVTEFSVYDLGVPAEGVVFQEVSPQRFGELSEALRADMWQRRAVRHSVDEDGYISAAVTYEYPDGSTAQETLRGSRVSDVLLRREVRAEGENTVIEYTYYDGSTQTETMEGRPSTAESISATSPVSYIGRLQQAAEQIRIEEAAAAEEIQRSNVLTYADWEAAYDQYAAARTAAAQQQNPEAFAPQLGRVRSAEAEQERAAVMSERAEVAAQEAAYNASTNPESFRPRLSRVRSEPSFLGEFRSAGIFTTQTEAEIVAANKAEADRLGLVNGDPASVINALRVIAKSGKPVQKAVASMLLANPSIVANATFVMAEFNRVDAGFYDPDTNIVAINLDGTNGRGLADVLLHEYIHAGTLDLIRNPQTKAQREAVQRLTALRNLTSQIAAQRGIDSAVFRAGLANNAEFVTYSLTAPEFQAILAQLSPPSQRSIWQRILDTIADFFGVGRETVNNALDEILNFTSMAFTTPNTFGESVSLGSARDQDALAPQVARAERAVVAARAARAEFLKTFGPIRYAAPIAGTGEGDLTVDTIEVARVAMPQGVEMVEDPQLAGVAGFSRANPNQILVNPAYLAQSVKGLPAHKAAAVVRSTIDEEVAHMAADSVFSEADYADIAEMMGETGLNLVAHEYYSLKHPSFTERSAAIRADRESGILSDVTLASEWTRIQVSRMATGTTRERDLDMILDNKSLVDKMISALMRFVETLRERFNMSPTASTAAKISQASRMMRRLRNEGVLPTPEPSPEGEMGDTTYLLAALSNQTVEGQEDRTSFAVPVAAINPDQKSFIERFWDTLGERGKVYNMPTALRNAYNDRGGMLSSAQYDIQLFNKKFVRLRDAAMADGIPMEDLMVVLGTTEPIVSTPEQIRIRKELRTYRNSLSPQDPDFEQKVREKENDLSQGAALTFRAAFRKKQEAMEQALRARGYDEVVDLMVDFRTRMNKFKTIVKWDATNDVYLTRLYRYYDTPGWHAAVRNGTVFTDDTGTEVDFSARRRVAAHSLYEAEVLKDLQSEGIPATPELIGQRVLAKLDEHLDNLDKMHAEEYSPSMTSSIRQDTNLLKNKREVDEKLRELLGEVKDPLEVAVRTMHSLSRMASNKTFYDSFESIAISQGLASYTPNDNMDLLFPSRQSDRYGKLAGLYVRKDIANALREELDLQLGGGKSNATGAIASVTKGLTHFSGLAITAKTALGVGYWTRNIIGGGLLTVSQGLTPISRDSLASFKSAWRGNFIGAESDENQREVIRRLTELQILRDDTQGRMITDMMRGFMTNADQSLDEALQMILEAQATGNMEKVKGLWDKLYSTPLEKVTSVSATLNNFVDSFFKTNAYFQELRMLKDKFGDTHSEAELEQRAAYKVKLTFPTHSQTLDITRAFNRSPLALLFLPFLRWKTEIVRTMINTPLLAASEMKNGEFTRGLRRLAGFSTVVGGGGTIVGKVVAMIFGMLGDDEEDKGGKRSLTAEEQEQIRMGLPKWQRLHALHMQKIGGSIQVIDLNNIMPHSVVTGVFSLAIDAARSGRGIPAKEMAAFLKSEVLGSNIAATALNEALNNRDDFGRPIYSESDSPLVTMRKWIGHVGSGTITPAIVSKTVGPYGMFRSGEKNRLEMALGELTGTRPQLHELNTVLDRGMRTVKQGLDEAVGVRAPLLSGKALDLDEIPEIFDEQQRKLNANQKKLGDLLRVMKSLGVEDSTIFSKTKDTGLSKQKVALAMEGKQLRFTPNAQVFKKMDVNVKDLGEEASAEPRFRALMDYVEKQPEIYDVDSY